MVEHGQGLPIETPAEPARADAVSRRTLLKAVGAGAVAIGAGGLLEACSPAATATPTTASGTPTPGPTSAGSPAASSAGKITIGFVTPQTGAFAGFASGDQFVVDAIRKTSAYANGFTVGGKTYDGRHRRGGYPIRPDPGDPGGPAADHPETTWT